MSATSRTSPTTSRAQGNLCCRLGLFVLTVLGMSKGAQAGVLLTDCAQVALMGPKGDEFYGDIRGTGINENTALCMSGVFEAVGKGLENSDPDTTPHTWQGIRDGDNCYMRPGAEKLPFMKKFCHGSSVEQVAGGVTADNKGPFFRAEL